jgi:hypothetical protein
VDVEFRLVYREGRAWITLVRCAFQMVYAMQMVAKSEELLLNSFFLLHPPKDLYNELVAYLQTKGWEVIKEG